MHLLSPNATADDFMTLVWREPADVKEKFRETCAEDIRECIEAIVEVHARLHEFEMHAPKDDRTATVQLFLYAAHNCIITSLHLLISGLAVPAGNLMRQYGEAVAMALLCSTPRSVAFARYKGDRQRYPFHDSLLDVNKKKVRQALGIKAKHWQSFMKLTKAFDEYSHISFMTLAHQLMLDEPGMLTMIGEYDPAKLTGYKAEFTRRKTGALVLEDLIRLLQGRLPFDPNEDGNASL